MRKQFDQELADIEGKVLRLFTLVPEAIAAAIEAHWSAIGPGDRRQLIAMP